MTYETKNAAIGQGELYRALFDAIPGISCLIACDAPRYTILAATPQLVSLTGLEKKDVIGKDIFELFPPNASDPNETGETNLRTSFAHVLRFKEPHQLPVQRYDIIDAGSNFTERYWKAENRPVFSPDGEVAYIIHSADDITARVKAEKRENQMKGIEKAFDIFMDAPMVVGLVTGENYTLELANKAALKLWGKGPEIIGKPILHGLPELDGQGIIELFDKVRTTGQPYYAYEVPVTSYAGGKQTIHYFDLIYQPYYDEYTNLATGVFTISYDVTEVVLARKRIEDSEQRFRNLADESPMFVFIIDADPLAPVTYWNKTWLEYTGQSMEEAVGRAWNGIIHPDDVPVVMQYYAPAFQNKEPYFIPSVRVRRHDGAYRWHAFKGNPRFLANGDFNGFVGVGLDVHEQKLAEEALKQNEVQLQVKVAERTQELETQKAFIATILEASMDGIYALKAVHNTEGVITDFQYLFANNKIVKLLNLELPEIIGASMLALIPENKTNGFFDLFCKLLQTKESFRGETHFVARGIDAWYDYVVVPVENEMLVVTIEDISGKKRAAMQMEEQSSLLDNILKNSSNGISVTEMIRDESGNVIDARTILANDAAVKYIGLPKDVFLSKTAIELDPDILNSAYGQTCLKTLETGAPSLSQYYMEVTGRWQELTISKMDDDHLIHIFTDITPIKEVQLQLERYVEDLKRSNKNLEEFAYAASHDLKEPIRKVHFFADRLREELRGTLNESQQIYFQKMEQASKRMGTLIDDLLMYSHVSLGMETKEAIDLNQTMKAVLEDLELEILEKRVEIKVGKLPTIKGHQRQLQQLFQNLISNAIKYNKAGVAPLIHITSNVVKGKDTSLPIQADEGNRNYHLLEIRDNGIGFPQEDADRIFNVFTRLHGNAEYKGTGVGLSIARKVAENHNGYIWAESRPGEGAIFNVLLPVA